MHTGVELCTGHVLLGAVGGSRRAAFRNEKFLILLWPSSYARVCNQWAGSDFLFPGLKKLEIQNGNASDALGLGQFSSSTFSFRDHAAR